MATLGDILQTMNARDIANVREMYSFAKKNNFDIGWYNQSEDKRPRIMVTIYPEGKNADKYRADADTASYYFYIKDEDKKDSFGSYSRPEQIRKGGKTIKNFKTFMTAITERYESRYKKNIISKIVTNVVKESFARG